MRSPFASALPLIAARAVGLVVALLIPVVLVRVFTQTEFGLYKQVFLVYATLFGIAQIGLAESLYYFLPQDPRRGGRFALNAMLGLAAAGLVCIGLLYAAAPALASRMTSPELAGYLPLIGLYLVLMLVSAVLEIVMISRQRNRLASVTYVVSDLLRAAAYILPVLMFPRLEALLWGAALFAAIRVLATLAYLRNEFSGDMSPDTTLLKGQLGYAFPFAVAVVVEVVQSNLHQYAVMARFDAATFAIYAVGCLQIPMVDLIGSSVGNVMMVAMTRARASGRTEEVVALWKGTTRNLALVFCPLAGLMIVCAPEIIGLLFTPAYLPSVPIFRLWSLSILAAVLQVDCVLRVHAETRFIFLLNTIRLLMVAALINPFITAFQLSGAVVVSLLATFGGKAIALARMARLLRTGVPGLLPWRDLAAVLSVSAAAAVPALVVRSELAPSLWGAAIAASFTYVAAYVTLVLGLRLVDLGHLREFAASMLPRSGRIDGPGTGQEVL